jgi:hypothetical protein
MPKTAATKKQDLKAKPDHYIECRQNHRWERLGFFHFRATQWYEADGTRLWTDYEYPDHYLLQGTGRVLPKEVRREAFRRAAIYGSEEMLDMTLTEDQPSPARKAV